MAISERYRVDYITLSEPYVTPESLEWAIERDKNMQQFAKKILEELGLAEAQLANQKYIFDKYAAESKATIDNRDAKISSLEKELNYERMECYKQERCIGDLKSELNKLKIELEKKI